MTRTLVSLDADLASSIALRYAGQLAKQTGMQLQTIHVVEPDREGHTPGAGWVRRTWERGLLETAQGEIAQLIKAERVNCPALGAPKLLVGDHEREILNELQRGSYDLFMEGLLYSFDSTNFYKKIRSRFYRDLPCPVILVKNLVSLQQGILMVWESGDFRKSFPFLLEVFGGAGVELDLLQCQFAETGEPDSQRRTEDLDRAGKMLSEKGWEPRQSRLVQGTPEKFEDLLRDYGLVVSTIHLDRTEKNPMLDLLSRTPSPILFCWV